MRHRSWEIFIRHWGDPSWDCEYCGEQIDQLGESVGVIHHRDNDHANDVLENLAAMHHACHTSHHKLGVPHSPEHIAKRAAARRGVLLPEPHRQALVAAWENRERTQTPEHIAARVASFIGRPLSADHREAIGKAQRGIPKSPEARAKMREAQRKRREREAMEKASD